MLAFFAASDGIVLENLGARFMKEVQLPEVCEVTGVLLAAGPSNSAADSSCRRTCAETESVAVHPRSNDVSSVASQKHARSPLAARSCTDLCCPAAVTHRHVLFTAFRLPLRTYIQVSIFA